MNARKLFGWALAAVLLLIVASFVWPVPSLRAVKSVSSPELSYDSAKGSSVVRRIEPSTLPAKDFAVSLHFKPYKTEGFTDLFQTAPLNSGARVELAGKVIALVVASTKSSGWDPFIITREYDINAVHTLEIRINTDKHISASLDGKEVLSVDDPDLNYKISEVTVGGGFDSHRSFRGVISGATYTYAFYEATGLDRLVLWVRICLSLLAAILLVLLVRAYNFDVLAFLATVIRTEESTDP